MEPLPSPPSGLDHFQRAALENLARSIETAGQTIRHVASWPDARVRDDHVRGALRCARISGDAARELLTTDAPVYITGTIGHRVGHNTVPLEDFAEHLGDVEKFRTVG